MAVTIEELIKLAQIGKGEVLKKPQELIDDVHKFILTVKIKEGKYTIKNALLYKAYCMWSPNPMGAMSFHEKFAKYFVQQRKNIYRYYLLNYRPIELLNRIDNLKIKK